MSKICVVGAGAWGTALAIQAIRSGNKAILVARDTARAKALDVHRSNPRLPGIKFPPALQVTDTVSSGNDLLLWAVPTQFLRASIVEFGSADAPIIVCAKGVERNTHMLPAEVVEQVVPGRLLAVLGGPTFAHEVARGLPAAAVVASIDTRLRDDVRACLGTTTFRLYGNDDPIGAQIGGAAKNVIAIAAGAVIGAGLGENARAALVSRGLSEISRLAVALGGRTETVMGLSGLGDLLLTCTGSSSRNFSLGHALGEGMNVDEVMANRSSVAEGLSTAPALVARAATVDLPICRCVASLLSGEITLTEAIAQLLARPQRDE